MNQKNKKRSDGRKGTSRAPGRNCVFRTNVGKKAENRTFLPAESSLETRLTKRDSSNRKEQR